MDEKATPHAQAPRPRFGSMVDLETSRLTKLFVDSHTTILRGLSLLAPKHRRSRVRWILAAGLLAVIGVLAAGRSTREFATSKARDFYRARIAAAAPAPVPAATVASTPAAGGVAWPSAVSVQVPAAVVPAAVVAEQAAEPTPAKDEAAPAAVPPTGSRAKTRGAKRPRVPSSRGGS